MVISLILFRCAKRFILPQKTKTSEKRVRSFQSQNCTAQSHKMQYLSQFFFLYRSSLTIQHKILFQRLSAFDNKLVIYVGKRGGLPRRLCFLIRELFRHKKIVVKVKVFWLLRSFYCNIPTILKENVFIWRFSFQWKP